VHGDRKYFVIVSWRSNQKENDRKKDNPWIVDIAFKNKAFRDKGSLEAILGLSDEIVGEMLPGQHTYYVYAVQPSLRVRCCQMNRFCVSI
jgi:hypothetical protein